MSMIITCPSCWRVAQNTISSLTKTNVIFCSHEFVTWGMCLPKRGSAWILKGCKIFYKYQPRNIVRSFKFFSGWSTLWRASCPTCPLCRLHSERPFKERHSVEWDISQENSFEQLRASLMQAPVLAYFQQNQPVVLSVDASQFGVGAVLLQSRQPVAYSSRSLTAAQQRCAQIEKETLAIVRGFMKCQDYIFGQPEIIVESDHRLLKIIFKKHSCECPIRIQRIRLVLQKFPITVTYKPGKKLLIADALSHFPSKVELREKTEQFVANVVSSLPIADNHLRRIREETKNDAVMSQLLHYSSTEWPKWRLEVPGGVRPFWVDRDELHTENGLLLRSNELVIPPAKRREVLCLLHVPHGGEDKMKPRALQAMFRPNMNRTFGHLRIPGTYAKNTKTEIQGSQCSVIRSPAYLDKP